MLPSTSFNFGLESERLYKYNKLIFGGRTCGAMLLSEETRNRERSCRATSQHGNCGECVPRCGGVSCDSGGGGRDTNLGVQWGVNR